MVGVSSLEESARRRPGCIISAFVISFRKYFPCQQRSSPGKRSTDSKEGGLAWWVKREGLQDNLGKHNRVIWGSLFFFSLCAPVCPLKLLWAPPGSQFPLLPLVKFPHTHTVKLLHFSSFSPLQSVSAYHKCVRAWVTEAIAPGETHPPRRSWTECVEFKKKKTYLPLAASAKDDLHSWPARHYITGKKSSLHFTVPPELKLHDEWRGNQIDFPMQRDTAALETTLEEEYVSQPGPKRTSR